MEDTKSRLYVGNLPYNTTVEELKEKFAEAGEVTDAVIISDKFSGKSKGFGFITMGTEEQAEEAIKLFDGKDFGGRTLKVNIAKPAVK